MIANAIEHFFREHWLELAGWSTTLIGIWLTTRRNLFCWPIILAADVLYLVVFYQARLLSDALLQAFFVVFTLYEIHLNRQIQDHVVLPKAKRIADKQGPFGEFDQDGLPG